MSSFSRQASRFRSQSFSYDLSVLPRLVQMGSEPQPSQSGHTQDVTLASSNTHTLGDLQTSPAQGPAGERSRSQVIDLTKHSTHFIYGYMASDIWLRTILIARGRKEGNVLFNDALNTFYLRLYGVRHMVKDHSDSKRKEGRKCFI